MYDATPEARDAVLPRCTVVIPTYNAESTLDETLSALAGQTCQEPFEVVIADNRCTDASVKIALAWLDRLPLLRVVDASRAKGVSAARNDGVAAAATDLILICDADDVVVPGWVAAMLEALDRHDYVGGALETVELNEVNIQAWLPFPPITPELPRTWEDRVYAFGGNLGMHRKVFDAAGGFDESYGAGAEEIDFAWRAHDAGFEPEFVPDAIIHYRLRTDLRAIMRQQYHAGLGNAQLYVTFRPAEVRVKSWHRRVRHELAVLRTFPVRGGKIAWGSWLTTAAFEAGMVRGALRYRCPVP